MKTICHSDVVKTMSSKVCPKHLCNLTTFKMGGFENEFCEQCEAEERVARTQSKKDEVLEQRLFQRYGNWLFTKSLIDDKTLLKATMDNYSPRVKRQQEAWQHVESMLDDLKKGETFNVVFTGNAGTGKSHLSYAMLRELNELPEKRCLFINTASLFTKLRSVFNGDTRYSEYELLTPIKQADFVVLDDIGSEVGKINASTQATDYVTRTLYEILNARQDKVTIWNTNLSSTILKQIYDAKVVSRLFKNISNRVIVFDWSDERTRTK